MAPAYKWILQTNDGSTHDLTNVATWSGGNVNITDSGFVTGVAGGQTGIGAQDSSEPVYATPCSGVGDICPVAFGVGGGASGNVYDGTPVINSISGQPWPAGTQNYQFTISGTGFGTSPALTITPDAGVVIDGYGITNPPSPTDTQISAWVTVDESSQAGSVTVAVTDQGMNGNSFIGASGQSQQGSSNAQVQAAPVPVNFKLTGVTVGDTGTLGLLSTYSWQSSDGHLGDLSSCSMREYVTYPSSNNSTCPGNSPPQQCFYPNSPPWAGSGSQYAYPNPTSPTPGPATGGQSEDTNAVYNLNFVKPYKADSFNAIQYIQYSCNKGATWTNIYGPRTITRSVSQSGSSWVATISMSDSPKLSTYTLP